jgi:putative DNA primase/helicase
MSGLTLSADQVERIARRCLGDPNPRLSTRRELRFGSRGSIVVRLDRAVWFNHETGNGGAIRDLAASGLAVASESPAERRARQARHEAEDRRKRAVAARLWASAGPLAGSLGERYLRHARAIRASLELADLRFAPAVPLRPLAPSCAATAPAIVARISTAAGDAQGVHVTFLRLDGSGKADVPEPRKIIGRAGGGLIRLAPGARLVVAEGIESALSAWEALGPVPGLGAAAAISAGGLATLTWPADAVELIIAPDRDASGAGEAAAMRLAERAHAAGLRVGFLRPPAGFGDWNDAARASGARPWARS